MSCQYESYNIGYVQKYSEEKTDGHIPANAFLSVLTTQNCILADIHAQNELLLDTKIIVSVSLVIGYLDGLNEA